MTTVEKKVDEIIRFLTADSEEKRSRAHENLRGMVHAAPPPHKKICTEFMVHEIMKDIGVPAHVVGYPYVVEAVLLVLSDQMYINNITSCLYPQLAAKFDTTAARVERGIRNAVSITFERSDLDVLGRYFGNSVSPKTGKPTNSQFIAQVANEIRMRQKEN